MIILVSGATVALRRHWQTGHFGQLLVPRGGNNPADRLIHPGLPWACDNDAFGAFDPVAFRKMLAKVEGHPGCRFVSCPDVVCDPIATLGRFEEWSPEIVAVGQPVAFVGQDGCEDMRLPWDRFEALFIGGSTSWKEGRSAMRLCDEAKRRGKWVHVGRVNTFRRVRKLWDWGTVDSIDGTTFSKWSNTFLPKAVGWLAKLEAQGSFLGDPTR